MLITSTRLFCLHKLSIAVVDWRDTSLTLKQAAVKYGSLILRSKTIQDVGQFTINFQNLFPKE